MQKQAPRCGSPELAGHALKCRWTTMSLTQVRSYETAGPNRHDPAVATAFRDAMRGLASTVTLVTAAEGVDRYAVVATSFTPLSMDPPSILVCLNRKSSICPPLMRGISFCVSILAETHRDLAHICSRSELREKRFEAGRFALDYRGTPHLLDAQAVIHCVADGRHLYGSHAILIGRVDGVTTAPAISPLVYIDGEFLEKFPPRTDRAPRIG